MEEVIDSEVDSDPPMSTPLRPFRLEESIESQQLDMASVMVIREHKSIEEQISDMNALLTKLMKDGEEKDVRIKKQNEQIARLIKKLKKEPVEDAESSDDALESQASSESYHEKSNKEKNVPLTAQQVQSMIAKAVRNQAMSGDVREDHRYVKPYTRRIDKVCMPVGYSPPKFNQFDGKGNPKQHIAHFVETCSNAGTADDLLVKQFFVPLRVSHLIGTLTYPINRLIVGIKWKKSF